MSPMVRVFVLGAAEQAERRMAEMTEMILVFIVGNVRDEAGLQSTVW